MARAVTADELIKLRSDGQKSDLFLAIIKPATVYSARVNQVSFTDPVAQVTYDGGSGTLGNVLPGMTIYVGTQAGGYDKGMLRVRKSPTGTIFYIGETSEINWADNDYLTVVNEFGLWPKHVRLVGSTAYMDYDIGYSDQHAALVPYPILGPDAVLWLPAGGTVDFTPNASESWVLGSSISSYLWTAPGASATLNLGNASPTITYNAAGTYRVGCAVTAANGKTATGYRTVCVFSAAVMPVTQFELLNCMGEYEGGGWEFGVRMYAEAGIADVRDRAKVILFAQDWHGSTAGSLGPITGYENIIATGWIDGESIQVQSDAGLVEFAVKGPNAWLNQMTGYPVGIERTVSAATAWTQMQGLTVDHGLWHLLHWRTTASLCMDAFLQGDTRSLPVAEAPATSIWGQFETLGHQTILARPVCDRYGRMFCQIDIQYLSTAARAAIPVVQEITREDWTGTVNVERAPMRKCSMLQLSGIQDDNSGPLMSWARGGVFTLYGTTQSMENLLLDNQADCNALAGNYFAWLNNVYPNIDIELAQNNRMIDIAPRQRIALSLAAGDTPRGLVWASKNLVPRRMAFEHDAESGFLAAKLECEGETGGAAAVDGQTIIITPPPLIGDGDIGFDLPDFDAWGSWPALTPLVGGFSPPRYIPEEPQIPIVPGATCPTDAPANGPYVVPITGSLSVEGVYSAYGGIGAVIRTGSHGNQTTYELRGTFEKYVNGAWVETYDDDWYVVEAVSAAGTVIATGVHNTVTNPRIRTGTLNAPSATPIAYLHIKIAASQLLRPTVVTRECHTGHFWWPVTSLGALDWGLSGAGVWASLVNVEIAGLTEGYNFDGGIGSTIILGANYEFNGRAFIIKQVGYAETKYAGWLQNYMVGIRDPGQLVGMWQEEQSGSAHLSQQHIFEEQAEIRLGAKLMANAHIPTAQPIFLLIHHHFLLIKPKALYRMNLTQTTMWNLCQRSS